MHPMRPERATIQLDDTAVLDRPASYVIDASQIQLEEKDGKKQSWLQALPLGEYEHPFWGKIEITKEKVKEFADNVNNNVRGIQLDIDYEHKNGPQGGKAAGWVNKAEDRGDDGLWILVEWTSQAAKELEEGEWKYFSAEFDWEWTHPKTKTTYKNVLFGGALTNRPFIKDIQPINLAEILKDGGINLGDIFKTPEGKYDQGDAHYRASTSSTRRCLNCALYRDGSCLVVDGDIDEDYISDFFTPIYSYDATYLFSEQKEETEKPDEGEVLMDPKELRKALGLSEDATDEQVLAKVKELTEKQPEDLTPKLREILQLGDEQDDEKVLAEVRRLHEGAKPEDAKAKKFEEDYPDQAKEMAEMRRRNRENDADKLLSDLSSGTLTNEAGDKVKVGLAPVVFEEVKNFRMSLSDANAGAFDKMLKKLISSGGIVELGESGTKQTDPPKTGETNGKAAVALKEAIQKKIDAAAEQGNTLKFEEARALVRKENPELFEEWQKERAHLSRTGTEDV